MILYETALLGILWAIKYIEKDFKEQSQNRKKINVGERGRGRPGGDVG